MMLYPLKYKDYFLFLFSEIQLELPNSNCNRKCLPSTDYRTPKPTKSDDYNTPFNNDTTWPFKWPSC